MNDSYRTLKFCRTQKLSNFEVREFGRVSYTKGRTIWISRYPQESSPYVVDDADLDSANPESPKVREDEDCDKDDDIQIDI